MCRWVLVSSLETSKKVQNKTIIGFSFRMLLSIINFKAGVCVIRRSRHARPYPISNCLIEDL